MIGMEVVTVPSDERGNVDLDALRKACDDTIAGLMLTNPTRLDCSTNTFRKSIQIVHQAGGLVYGDGANLNALMGIVRPADMGIDVMHFNLHKTFSTPHGGGGPGSGPVGVSEKLVDYLPHPLVAVLEEGEEDLPPLYGFVKPAKSIGRMKSFHGHFGVLVRAFTYIMMHGGSGLRRRV